MSHEQPMKHEIGKRTYFVADVEPIDVDGTKTVIVGTILWAVTFVGLLPFKAQLDEAGLTWILWTCLAGVGLGFWGYEHVRRSRAKRLAQLNISGGGGRRRADLPPAD